jgi:RNA polymerase sigma-70 factor (ECF subfamily)
MYSRQPKISPELISLIKAGDLKAFADFYHLYSSKVYRFAYDYLKCREDAEEVVQEVFIKIWEKRNEIRKDLSLNAFMFTIAHNTTLNLLRKRKNGVYAKAKYFGEMSTSHLHVEEDLISNELAKSAQVAIDALPVQRKKVYLLSRQYHLTYKEIAAKLNISTKTVEVHMTHALSDIRKRLIDLGIILLLVDTLGSFLF